TTVTTAPERVMTQRQVDLTLQAPQVARVAPPAPAPAPAPAPPRAAEPPPAPPAPAFTPAPEAQVAARELPRTASPLPAIGLVGAAFSAVGFMLMMRRRRLAGE